MRSFWDKTFAVVDLETTGSDAIKNRIMEISIVFIKGGEIVSDISTLVNPNQFIPPFIANMTGISNQMAYSAPQAESVFPKIAEELSKPDTVFVAHNMEFDWSFLYETMLRLGLNVPAMPRLCSLKIARRILPKPLKKNVGSLAEWFNIPMRRAHRAYDDALATARIFVELLNIAENDHGLTDIDQLSQLQSKRTSHYNAHNPHLSDVKKMVMELPHCPGVYYFKDENGEIIYVGKAKNLKRRVMSYFNNSAITASKIMAIVSRINSLSYEERNTELEALIHESTEIKRLSPKYNKANKRYQTFPFIKLTEDPFPRYEVCDNIIGDGAEYYGPFRNASLVNEISKIIDRNFKLRKCDEPLKPDSDVEPCVFFRMKRCDAPCAVMQSPKEYHLEVEKVRHFLSNFQNGIIDHLEESMYLYSDQMEFEKAAEVKTQINELKRLFSRQKRVPTSIQHNNLVLLLPAEKNEKKVEIYLIKSGRLVSSLLAFDMNSPVNMKAEIDKCYFDGNLSDSYTKEDIDQVRIITSWIYNNQERGEFIYIEDNDSDSLCNEINQKLQTLSFDHIHNDEV